MTVGILLPGLYLPPACMRDQSVAAFQADECVQVDPQLAVWAELRERIAPLLEEVLQYGLVQREIGGAP